MPTARSNKEAKCIWQLLVPVIMSYVGFERGVFGGRNLPYHPLVTGPILIHSNHQEEKDTTVMTVENLFSCSNVENCYIFLKTGEE
jgi:hypothetical protein